MKHSSVWVKPYDRWNHLYSFIDTIGFILLILTIFYHPFWLEMTTGLVWSIAGIGFVVILWLNERKKRRLAKSHQLNSRK